MRDTWGTKDNCPGDLREEKNTHFIEKIETIKGNKTAKDHWSRDLVDQVIVHVLKYISFYFN